MDVAWQGRKSKAKLYPIKELINYSGKLYKCTSKYQKTFLIPCIFPIPVYKV